MEIENIYGMGEYVVSSVIKENKEFDNYSKHLILVDLGELSNITPMKYGMLDALSVNTSWSDESEAISYLVDNYLMYTFIDFLINVDVTENVSVNINGLMERIKDVLYRSYWTTTDEDIDIEYYKEYLLLLHKEMLAIIKRFLRPDVDIVSVYDIDKCLDKDSFAMLYKSNINNRQQKKQEYISMNLVVVVLTKDQLENRGNNNRP